MDALLKTFPSGSVAVVTGGGSGLGRELCKQLAVIGMIVYVNDINGESAEQTVSNIAERNGKAEALVFDVSNQTDCQSCIESIFNRHGSIDLLITNAGKVAIGEFHSVPLDSWHNLMDINFFGQLNMIKAIYPFMQKQKNGHIVIVSSIAGLVFQPLTASYSASKNALVGFACSLYTDAIEYEINVHLACPGYIGNTDIFSKAVTFGYSSVKVQDILKYKVGGFISAEKAAQKIIGKLSRKKFFMVFPFNAKLLWFFYRMMPSMTVRKLHFLKDLMAPAKSDITS